MYFVSLQGQGTSRLAGGERHAHRMHAGHHALHVFVDLGEDRQADARHDAHVHHDVRGVGELHADLRAGRVQRAHAEGQHVHGAAPHGAVEKVLQLAAHLVGVFPVIGGPGAVFARGSR